MAKISKHGGPSIDGPVQHALSRRPTLGVAKSVGNNSNKSGETEKTKDNDETPLTQSPAPTTENPFDRNPGEGDSIAPSTDGGTQKTQSPRSAKKAATTAGKKPNLRSVNNDDDEFDEPVKLSGGDEDDFK